jgi:hypothetical protein
VQGLPGWLMGSFGHTLHALRAGLGVAGEGPAEVGEASSPPRWDAGLPTPRAAAAATEGGQVSAVVWADPWLPGLAR